MRTIFLSGMIAVLLLGSCKKTATPVNFAYTVQGGTIQGWASTSYNAGDSAFQLTMTGPSNQSVNIIWYGVDSILALRNLAVKTYTLPAIPLPPITITASYTSAFGAATYYPGTGRNLGGTVTLTKNTGPAGTISGTFSFNALNAANSADTAYVTNGSFTNVFVTAN